MIGALKDITFIPPGVDLTEPADPDWADIPKQKRATLTACDRVRGDDGERLFRRLVSGALAPAPYFWSI